MFYVFSFPPAVCVGTLNLIASIPGPSILTLDSIFVLFEPYVRFRIFIYVRVAERPPIGK